MEDNRLYLSVNDLKQMASEQNTAISLRVKDSTRSLFELLAKEQGTTVSALINSLLDYYANHYIKTSNDEIQLNQQTLRRYTETIARKAGILDSETLLRDTITEYRPDALFEHYQSYFPIATEEQLIRDFGMWAQGLPTHFFNQRPPYIHFSHIIAYATNLETPAKVEIDRFFTATEAADYHIMRPHIDVYLPAPKWIIMVSILSAFSRKSHELFNHSTIIGETALRSIAYLSNHTKNNLEFAKYVAEIILQENLPDQSQEDQNSQPSSQAQPQSSSTAIHSPKTTWADIAVAALEELGGEAKTSSIYRACRQIANTIGKPITHKNENSFNMSIQGTLETKTEYFNNPEKGLGIWRVNPGVHFDKTTQRAVIN